MPVHTCAPPKDADPEGQTLWICPSCGSTWEAASDVGIFDFDRNEAITRAEWVLIEGPDYLAG
ncbi:MAG TPA: hypothetical protein VJ913_08265 [Actinomycetota bacterium]|nr:hypothetical protein [Actinomycetota bacterium]